MTDSRNIFVHRLTMTLCERQYGDYSWAYLGNRARKSEYSRVLGNSATPYFNSLAIQYGLATNYYAIRYPNLPNYLALIGGSISTRSIGPFHAWHCHAALHWDAIFKSVLAIDGRILAYTLACSQRIHSIIRLGQMTLRKTKTSSPRTSHLRLGCGRRSFRYDTPQPLPPPQRRTHIRGNPNPSVPSK